VVINSLRQPKSSPIKTSSNEPILWNIPASSIRPIPQEKDIWFYGLYADTWGKSPLESAKFLRGFDQKPCILT
jgi:hypothetical protein